MAHGIPSADSRKALFCKPEVTGPILARSMVGTVSIGSVSSDSRQMTNGTIAPVRDPHLPRALGLLRSLGLRKLVLLALRHTWSSHVSFGLRADLDRLPEVRPARIAVCMEPRDTASFGGFVDELDRVSGGDAVEVVQRQSLCAAGVQTLYVAVDDSGEPIYAQWLVRGDEQEALHRATNGLFPQLGEGEALVEGAYTFVNSRKLGAMTDGMRQLLVRARDSGDQTVFTYVAEGNVPSLRGCAIVGFVPDHLRLDTRRLGLRRTGRVPLDSSSEARWAATVE